MPLLSTSLVMICATLAWLITSVVIWYLRKTRGELRGRRECHTPEEPIENRQPESALRDDAICREPPSVCVLC